MLQIHVNDSLIALVEEYLLHHNLGNRGVEDGDYKKQRTGLIGECVVTQYLTGSLPNLESRKNGFDGGFDIVHHGHCIDVKTMGRNSFVKPHYVNNFYLLQKNHFAHIVVFASFHNLHNVLEICGWLPKRDLPVRGKFFKAGTQRIRTDGTTFTFRQSNYEVENKALLPIAALKNIGQK